MVEQVNSNVCAPVDPSTYGIRVMWIQCWRTYLALKVLRTDVCPFNWRTGVRCQSKSVSDHVRAMLHHYFDKGS